MKKTTYCGILIIMKEVRDMEIECLVKCSSCGEIFPHDELREREIKGCLESDYGVYDQFGSHTYYTDVETYCPHCGSSEELIDGYRCNECENFTEWLADENYAICEECLSKYTFEKYITTYPSCEK